MCSYKRGLGERDQYSLRRTKDENDDVQLVAHLMCGPRNSSVSICLPDEEPTYPCAIGAGCETAFAFDGGFLVRANDLLPTKKLVSGNSFLAVGGFTMSSTIGAKRRGFQE